MASAAFAHFSLKHFLRRLVRTGFRLFLALSIFLAVVPSHAQFFPVDPQQAQYWAGNRQVLTPQTIRNDQIRRQNNRSTELQYLMALRKKILDIETNNQQILAEQIECLTTKYDDFTSFVRTYNEAVEHHKKPPDQYSSCLGLVSHKFALSDGSSVNTVSWDQMLNNNWKLMRMYLAYAEANQGNYVARYIHNQITGAASLPPLSDTEYRSDLARARVEIEMLQRNEELDLTANFDSSDPQMQDRNFVIPPLVPQMIIGPNFLESKILVRRKMYDELYLRLASIFPEILFMSHPLDFNKARDRQEYAAILNRSRLLSIKTEARFQALSANVSDLLPLMSYTSVINSAAMKSLSSRLPRVITRDGKSLSVANALQKYRNHLQLVHAIEMVAGLGGALLSCGAGIATVVGSAFFPALAAGDPVAIQIANAACTVAFGFVPNAFFLWQALGNRRRVYQEVFSTTRGTTALRTLENLNSAEKQYVFTLWMLGIGSGLGEFGSAVLEKLSPEGRLALIRIFKATPRSLRFPEEAARSGTPDHALTTIGR